MAVQPDTVTGTITLVSGSVDFTTSGTQMLTRGHLPGDIILRNGFALIIETITGENAGTLRDVCPAGAAGTGPVRLRYQSDGSRVAAQTRNLIDLLGNGTLQSLSSLTFGANKLIKATGAGTLETFDGANIISEAAIDGTGGNWLSYYTGAGAKARSPFTALARTLLGGASGNAMLATLGVSAFARTLLDDADASSVLTTLGISAFAKMLLDDADAAAARSTLALGLASSPQFASASLVGASAVGLLVERAGAPVNSSIEVKTSAGSLFIGNSDGSRFSVSTDPSLITTERFGVTSTAAFILGQVAYHRANVVGTVSQTGGVPTGALFQTGTNGQNRFVRFPDGTQIVWGSTTSSATAGVTVPLSAAFDGLFFVAGGTISSSLSLFIPKFTDTSGASMTVNVVNTSDARLVANIHWIAIGRWYL